MNIGNEDCFYSNNIIVDQGLPQVIEKKKRGRKPKNQNQNLINEIKEIKEVKNNNVETDIPPEGIILKKKRGRKANTKIINLTPEVNVEIVNNLIAHLPLKMNDIVKIINKSDKPQDEKNEIKQKPQIKYVDFSDDAIHNNPKPKNEIVNNSKNIMYEEIISKLEREIEQLKNGIISGANDFNKKIYESKVNLLDKSSNTWTEHTDIACWWCCHKFDHIPLGIPEYIIKDTFYLSGCFCSFNCMMAYNIDLNDYKIWERQSNIYQMKNKIDPDNKIPIHVAPPRQILDLFGGPLNIDQYRESFFIVNKEFRYFCPPMISIVGIIEEDNRDISGNNRIKLHRNSNNLIVKRNKPLPKHSTNLNAIVNVA